MTKIGKPQFKYRSNELLGRLERLSTKGIAGINNDKPTLEAVAGFFPDGTKIYMERIIGSCHYLSHRRKTIYDVAFDKLYYHNGAIPEGHVAIENILYKIEDQATVMEEDKFIEILDRHTKRTSGTRFYLDKKLYMDNVPLMKSDGIRDALLQQRRDNILWFDVLRIIDLSGNVTEFYPSDAVKMRHVASKAFKEAGL